MDKETPKQPELHETILELVKEYEQSTGKRVERFDVSHFKNEKGDIVPHLVTITQYS